MAMAEVWSPGAAYYDAAMFSNIAMFSKVVYDHRDNAVHPTRDSGAHFVNFDNTQEAAVESGCENSFPEGRQSRCYCLLSVYRRRVVLCFPCQQVHHILN